MTQKTDLNITYTTMIIQRIRDSIYRASKRIQHNHNLSYKIRLKSLVIISSKKALLQLVITDMDVYFIKVQADNPNNESGALDDVEYVQYFTENIFKGQTTGVVLKLLLSVAATSSDTLICKLYTQGNDRKFF